MAPSEDIARQLRTLAELHGEGVLTDDEFERSKARLLGTGEPAEASVTAKAGDDAAEVTEVTEPSTSTATVRDTVASPPTCAAPGCVAAATPGSPWCLAHGTPRTNTSPALLIAGSFLGVLVLIGVVGGLVALGSNSGTTSAQDRARTARSDEPTREPESSTAESEVIETDAREPEPLEDDDDLTTGQRNAVGSAEGYLAMSGFSRAGLIQQLSSPAGEGYPRADAVFAVDHVDADWNAEAVESARAYLELTPMSRAGLIQQLTSSAGEQFTLAQAQYAASKVY